MNLMEKPFSLFNFMAWWRNLRGKSCWQIEYPWGLFQWWWKGVWRISWSSKKLELHWCFYNLFCRRLCYLKSVSKETFGQIDRPGKTWQFVLTIIWCFEKWHKIEIKDKKINCSNALLLSNYGKVVVISPEILKTDLKLCCYLCKSCFFLYFQVLNQRKKPKNRNLSINYMNHIKICITLIHRASWDSQYHLIRPLKHNLCIIRLNSVLRLISLSPLLSSRLSLIIHTTYLSLVQTSFEFII